MCKITPHALALTSPGYHIGTQYLHQEKGKGGKGGEGEGRRRKGEKEMTNVWTTSLTAREKERERGETNQTKPNQKEGKIELGR